MLFEPVMPQQQAYSMIFEPAMPQLQAYSNFMLFEHVTPHLQGSFMLFEPVLPQLQACFYAVRKTPDICTVTAFLKEFWLPSLGRDEDLLPDVPLLLLPVPEHVEGLLGHQLPPLHTGYAPPCLSLQVVFYHVILFPRDLDIYSIPSELVNSL